MESRTVGSSGVKDKIDLSLDDIIRLNKKQRQASKKGTVNRKVPPKGRLPQGKRPGPSPSTPGGTAQRGDISRFAPRGHRGPPAAVKRRRAQGVITGLAARRSTTVFRGIAPLNRPMVDQKTKPFVHEMQRRRINQQRRPYRQTEAPKPSHTFSRKPIQLRRTAPPTHQVQREARQATFFSRRGLKVQAAVPKTTAAPVVHQMRQWRTPSTVNGILTVCIDNPTARTQPEPARAWSLHPQSTPAVEVKEEKKPDKKPPKGVALQFDINSVGKQHVQLEPLPEEIEFTVRYRQCWRAGDFVSTTITLNERFRVLKERRTTAAKSTKAGRFVTVG
ncbi:UAP56-interacting factor-like isoform X2 [Engraulis encrasicolus]|uniref:UAP56-interacting factor-like isoform X2 n=1 Tax=Engraulis encrasicolus TaxID=184585 RepID=UPI002FD01580